MKDFLEDDLHHFQPRSAANKRQRMQYRVGSVAHTWNKSGALQ